MSFPEKEKNYPFFLLKDSLAKKEGAFFESRSLLRDAHGKKKGISKAKMEARFQNPEIF